MAELNPTSRKTTGKNATKKMPVRVDLTAMVDLAFLLITFFMLTTSLAKPRSMPLAMPADSPPGPVSEKCTMTIDLGKNNNVVWYLGRIEKPLSAPQIVSYGKSLQMAILETGKQVYASTGKNLMVIIKPTEHAVYQNLVEALDELNLAQVRSYAIAAVSPADVALLKQKGVY